MECVRIKVVWLDRQTKEIHEGRDYHLGHKVNTLKVHVKEMERCLNLMKKQLREVEETLAEKKKNLTSVSNYPTKVFKSLHTSI